jgi:uncharacterized membrane protein YhaH (DUF805 family)
MLQISYEDDGFPKTLRSEAACRREIELGRLTADTPIVVYEENGDRTRMIAEQHSPLRPLLGLEPFLSVEEEAETPTTAAPVRTATPVRAFGRAGTGGPRPSVPTSPNWQPPQVAPTHGTIEEASQRKPTRATTHHASGEGAWYWMTLPFRRYADFQGRSRRKEYWMFSLLNLGIVFVCAMFSAGESSTAAVMLVLYLLLAVVPYLALSVRRLHDIGVSGWLLLISIIPYVGGLALFVLTIIPGKQGDNKYGQDPKYGSDTDVFA